MVGESTSTSVSGSSSSDRSAFASDSSSSSSRTTAPAEARVEDRIQGTSADGNAASSTEVASDDQTDGDINVDGMSDLPEAVEVDQVDLAAEFVKEDAENAEDLDAEIATEGNDEVDETADEVYEDGSETESIQGVVNSRPFREPLTRVSVYELKKSRVKEADLDDYVELKWMS